MSSPKIEQLAVPGASLYCEVRGSGPVLVLVPGGNGDALPYQGIADALATRYTVVTYDRRGFSRSPLDAPPDDAQRLATDVEDVNHLLDHVGAQTATVFGSSSGAIVALEWLTRHGDRADAVVAHEPPLVTLLPDADTYLAFIDKVHRINQEDGMEEAMQMFGKGIGSPMPRLPKSEEVPAAKAEIFRRVRANCAFWLEHELRQYPRTVVDTTKLAAQAPKLMLVGGSASRELFPYLPNLELAKKLNLEVVNLPGDHTGYMAFPAAFAAELGDRLAARTAAAT